MNHEQKVADVLVDAQGGLLATFAQITPDTYQEVMNKAVESVSEMVNTEINAMDLIKKVREINTVDELSEMEIPTFSHALNTHLAEHIDSLEYPYHTRVFLFLELRRTLESSLKEYIRALLQGRAQELLQSRIITPKPSKLIVP